MKTIQWESKFSEVLLKLMMKQSNKRIRKLNREVKENRKQFRITMERLNRLL